MSVACQIRNGKNAINIYDVEFDEGINYQIRLSNKNFCSAPVIVDVDGVFYCKDNAKLSFELPCVDVGEYVLEVLNKETSDVIYKFMSIYY